MMTKAIKFKDKIYISEGLTHHKAFDDIIIEYGEEYIQTNLEELDFGYINEDGFWVSSDLQEGRRWGYINYQIPRLK